MSDVYNETFETIDFEKENEFVLSGASEISEGLSLWSRYLTLQNLNIHWSVTKKITTSECPYLSRISGQIQCINV